MEGVDVGAVAEVGPDAHHREAHDASHAAPRLGVVGIVRHVCPGPELPLIYDVPVQDLGGGAVRHEHTAVGAEVDVGDETGVALEAVRELEAFGAVVNVDVVVVAARRDPTAVGAPLDGVDVLSRVVIFYPLPQISCVVYPHVAVAVSDSDPLAVWAPAAVPRGVRQLGRLHDPLLKSAPDVQDTVLAHRREHTLHKGVRAEAAYFAVVTRHQALELGVAVAVVPDVQQHAPFRTNDNLFVLVRVALDLLLGVEYDDVDDGLVGRDLLLHLVHSGLGSSWDALVLLLLGLGLVRLSAAALARELPPRQRHVVSVEQLPVGVAPHLELAVAAPCVQLVALRGEGRGSDTDRVAPLEPVCLDRRRDGDSGPYEDVAVVRTRQEARAVHRPGGAGELPDVAGRDALPVREHLNPGLRVVGPLLLWLEVEEAEELALGDAHEGHAWHPGLPL
mmetsp:Transcript_1258/g.2794  ORF Transcript_1258/g.2794 Transcript_1258/m.2794 type:complete len:448 (+) Transcript_1258:455-1798(+)